MKKILITGINGFIGSAAKRYFEKKYIVYGIDIAGSPQERTYIIDMKSERLAEIVLEIRPDIILHAAGGANVSKSLEDPRADFDNNVQVFYSLLESVRQLDTKSVIIFLSSAAVYGNVKTRPISEETILQPISPYGLHKRFCEELASYYGKVYGMHIRILRIFSVYGPGLKKQIMWDMFQKFKKNGKIELFGTGNESRDFIYIDDLMQGIDLMIHTDTEEHIFNMANGEEITIRKVADTFSEILCGENRVTFNHVVRKGDPDFWQADIDKVKKLGYQKTVPLEQGIRNYIEWARKEVEE